jgi:hypothetical protein
MNITKLKQRVKRKLEKKWIMEKWNHVTGTEVINIRKLKYVVDVLAILGITTVLLLSLVITIPLMIIYMAVVGAIILWEEKDGI